MNTKIQPQYFPNAQIICSCGKIHIVGSTIETTQVEFCSNCHPFYTGEQKLMDSANRVKRFENLQTQSTQFKSSTPKIDNKKRKKDQKIDGSKPLTLRDMLKAVQEGNE